MSIVCQSCTFINVSSKYNICQVCQTPFEKKSSIKYDDLSYNDPFTIMTTDMIGEINPMFVEWFEKEFGVKISLSVQTVHSLQCITKRNEYSIKIMLNLTKKHFTIIIDDKKIDLGIYNIAPQNLPICIKDDYFNFLKKHNMDKKKCGNCCLPMCIIVAVLLEKHKQIIQDENLARYIQLNEEENLADQLKVFGLNEKLQVKEDENIAWKLVESNKKRLKKNRNRANNATLKLIQKLMTEDC